MTQPDATMTEIGRGMELSQRGERAAARAVFADVWDAIGAEAGDPFHRCAVAHVMADVQDDVHAELLWDLRSLEAADLVTDDRAATAGVTTGVAGFYPSLHLNLGECYRRIGEVELAHVHLRAGRAATNALADDGYGRFVRAGLDGLARRLAAP